MTATAGILNDVRHDAKSVPIKQRSIFGRIEARMIQRLARETPDRLAMRRAAGEHQRRPGRRVRAKHRKHAALVVMAEVKELSHAKMPENFRGNASLRISATIHCCAGKCRRQASIMLCDESTPTTG